MKRDEKIVIFVLRLLLLTTLLLGLVFYALQNAEASELWSDAKTWKARCDSPAEVLVDMRVAKIGPTTWHVSCAEEGAFPQWVLTCQTPNQFEVLLIDQYKRLATCHSWDAVPVGRG